MSPSIPVRDSGEFIAVSGVLGIAHPPGFPLFTLLSRLFFFFPAGNPAYRVNLLSALFGALTVLFIALSIRTARNKYFVTDKPAVLFFLLPAVYFGLFRAFVISSRSAEVFTLNSFFTAFLIFLFFQENKISLRLFAFVFGLALTNHQMIVFILPVFLLFYFLRHMREGLQAGEIPVLAALFFLGLSLYLYLPLRSIHNPPLDWGRPGTGFGSLINVLLRRDYGTFNLFPEDSSGNLLKVLKQQSFYFIEIFRQGGFILAGIFFCLFFSSGKLRLKLFLLSCFFLAGPIFVYVSNPPVSGQFEKHWLAMERFFLMPLCFIPIFTVFMNKKILLLFLSSGIILRLLFTPAVSARDNFLAYDIAANIQLGLERDSALMLHGDTPSYSMLAYQNAFRRRRDIAVILPLPAKWYWETLLRDYPLIFPDEKAVSGTKDFYQNIRIMLEKKMPVYMNSPEAAGLGVHLAGISGILFSTGRELNPGNDYIFRRPSSETGFDLEAREFYSDFHNNAGVRFEAAFLAEEALAQYRRSVLLRRTHSAVENLSELLYSRAYREYSSNSPEKTISLLERNIHLLNLSGRAKFYILLGGAYVSKSDYGRAEEKFLEALRLGGYDKEAHNNLAVLYDAAGKTQKRDEMLRMMKGPGSEEARERGSKGAGK